MALFFYKNDFIVLVSALFLQERLCCSRFCPFFLFVYVIKAPFFFTKTTKAKAFRFCFWPPFFLALSKYFLSYH